MNSRTRIEVESSVADQGGEQDEQRHLSFSMASNATRLWLNSNLEGSTRMLCPKERCTYHQLICSPIPLEAYSVLGIVHPEKYEGMVDKLTCCLQLLI